MLQEPCFASSARRVKKHCGTAPQAGYCSTCGTRSTMQVPAEHRATLSSVGAMHLATGQLVAAQLCPRQASWAASASL